MVASAPQVGRGGMTVTETSDKMAGEVTVTTWMSVLLERDGEGQRTWVFCGTRVPVAALFENLRKQSWIGFPASSAQVGVLDHET